MQKAPDCRPTGRKPVPHARVVLAAVAISAVTWALGTSAVQAQQVAAASEEGAQ